MNRIYLDHAATTPVDPAVAQVMQPYLDAVFGNPSAVYRDGQAARAGVEEARRQVAALLKAEPASIFFTSGGSESDNWAIKGTAFALRARGRHLITTAIEHPAVLGTCAFLERCGFEITYLPVDSVGLVDPKALKAAIQDDTILVSVMAANNEIGTVEPIAELAAVAHAAGVRFHTDAVQACGNVSMDVRALDVDLLSLSGHKFYGPKGAGALYVRPGCKLEPLIHGGEQERGRRAGTENTAAIVGIGAAAKLAAADQAAGARREAALRDALIAGLTAIPGVRLTGHPERRLPGNASFCFDDLRSEALLTALDLAGIEASGGSACTAGSLSPSHVLTAIGVPENRARNALRLTLGRGTTAKQIEQTVTAVRRIVERLRA
ncbi:putative cysteine desulfurase NifS [Pseudoramibacter alactolyticus ATCC 23263]|uniref:cysteine desulfurase n=1 Tax=Pseudoramibacter alactolyticus ATCC 23263 TaxID=887929 RepID=E6MG88_9FIRM|nr:cysteine desulfurase family protein [Pseudoramibacter alactolyticus]EFV01628.1 putative cysteine desulfurase NifS [Pseudoramibacter alactolyticus ATCC 23263]